MIGNISICSENCDVDWLTCGDTTSGSIRKENWSTCSTNSIGAATFLVVREVLRVARSLVDSIPLLDLGTHADFAPLSDRTFLVRARVAADEDDLVDLSLVASIVLESINAFSILLVVISSLRVLIVCLARLGEEDNFF